MFRTLLNLFSICPWLYNIVDICMQLASKQLSIPFFYGLAGWFFFFWPVEWQKGQPAGCCQRRTDRQTGMVKLLLLLVAAKRQYWLPGRPTHTHTRTKKKTSWYYFDFNYYYYYCYSTRCRKKWSKVGWMEREGGCTVVVEQSEVDLESSLLLLFSLAKLGCHETFFSFTLSMLAARSL